MGENEVINVLKLANNNELRYLQDKVEYLRIDELRETVSEYESSLSEKREKIAILNQEQKRLDNLVTNNNGNKNDDGIEIFYASGTWRNLTP